MTDNDIIKALECCNKDDCDNCPNTFGNCYANLAGYALDLINRQKAEIERLEKLIEIELDKLNAEKNDVMYYKDRIKSEAVKEFAERLKAINKENLILWNYQIDNLLKEMVGENNVD